MTNSRAATGKNQNAGSKMVIQADSPRDKGIEGPKSENTAVAEQTTATPSGPKKASLQRTLEQHRANNAQVALDLILDQNSSEKFQKEFRTKAMKLPTLVLTNGLGATLGYLAAKGGRDAAKPEALLAMVLKNWLTTGVVLDLGIINWGKAVEGDLLTRINKIDSETYRHVTIEALAWLTWLKRFVAARLGDQDDDDDAEEAVSG